MHDSIADLIPILDQALAECSGVVPETDLEPAAHIRNRIEARLRRPEDVLMVALAGGTGSGKSSLFNAIAGEELAETGGYRPTTSTPLALIPEPRAGALTGYLLDAGVEGHISRPGPEWLCLIDLPDTDSVIVDHRHTVDVLLPWLDVVVWVLDPEKYRDGSLHHGLIAPLSAYQRQFVFVLNQVDRFAGDETGMVLADLAVALEEIGIENPMVFPVAAQPAAGPVHGVEDLVQHLRSLSEEGAIHAKLVSDLESLVRRLARATGSGVDIDFEMRWGELNERIAADRSRAGVAVGTFLHDLADEVGGPTGSALRDLARTAPAALPSTSPPISPDPPSRRWGWRKRPSSEELEGQGSGDAIASDLLESEVGAPARDILARRARAQAVVAQLALEVRSLRARGA